ncbi:hypothetical protein APHAL10511_000786 [Amanita phalloides]|nr:hypothetical protein APHAL10511_000786 [Amanita phalloides]
MPAYDDWSKIDDDEQAELQDFSALEGKRDVILFCIDASESMLQLREDPKYEDVQTCHLFSALEAAVQIQKRKIITSPNDSVGILLFNAVRKGSSRNSGGSELKRNVFLYQPISQMSAPKIQEVIQLLDVARENPNELRNTFPPITERKMPMGDVFTSCNWIFRDGAPKTAVKRIFLITDEDNPHGATRSQQLLTSARTTLVDLIEAGITLEPFFISTEDKPFDISKFYSSILVTTNIVEEENMSNDPFILPESISISKVEEMLAQMRFRESPKRALFSVPFHLARDFTIGVKGYGLVTEQRKGTYQYFADLGDRMEVAISKTVYVDEDTEGEVDKSKLLYGPTTGPEEADDEETNVATRVAKAGHRPFYTAEEVKSFRTLGLDPGIRLLGFKDRNELAFEDNVKHSLFIYPDETAYSGSKRTFAALLKSMSKKDKIGLVLAMTRSNSIPTFCALLPQDEKADEGDPAGFHLIPLPFADDIRAAPIEEAYRASDKLTIAARAWIDKLSVKNGSYPPDSYPNPALAFHNEQLQASAFREEYDPDTFEDLTLPKYDIMRKRSEKLVMEWKEALMSEGTVEVTTTGVKRKAEVSVDEAEIRSKNEVGALGKLRVDQLKAFLKSKGQPISGVKAELMERVSDWLEIH